jgi:hypothetical protein
VKPLLVLIVVSAVLAALVPAAASAASPIDRKIAALQKQVTSLQKQVKALKQQTTFNTAEISANYAGDACLTVLTSDIFLGTWSTLTESGSFGTQAQNADKGACAAIHVPRPGVQHPPLVSVFDPFISWIKP